MMRVLQTISQSIPRSTPWAPQRRAISRISNDNRSNTRSDVKTAERVLKCPRIFYGAILLSFCGLLLSYYSMSGLERPETEQEQIHSKRLLIASGYHPVLDEADPFRFSNTPVSNFRPKNQFSGSDESVSQASDQDPVLSVITVTNNPSSLFSQTVDFMRQQSLRPISWLIVNDHSDSEESNRLLKRVAESDNRFTLLKSSSTPGYTHGRIAALNHILKHPTKYFAFLDDDDMYELTGYEKCVWMLESNKNVSMCGSYVVGFGEKNYTLDRSFHNDQTVHMDKNPLTGSEVLRTDILTASNCTFDVELDGGMADWERYLCYAKQGIWGTTIPEHLFWQRQNPVEMRKKRWSALLTKVEENTAMIQQRYKRLKRYYFPGTAAQYSAGFETIPTEVPFHNPLSLEKSVLLIISGMARSPADTVNFNLVQALSNRGYRVTIVCTLLDTYGKSMLSRPYFMQYTHDVFFLPGMLRVVDVPSFLSYLIESRKTELVMISDSQMGYGMLPWLAAKYDDIRFIDYVHDEAPDSKNKGYNMLSAVHEASLDATFTSSLKSKQLMLERGHSGSSLHVGHLGIGMKDLNPFSEDKKLSLRKELGISSDATVITYVGKMVDGEPLKVVLEAFQKTIDNERASSQFLVVGDGPKLSEIEGLANEQIRVVRGVDHENVIKHLGLSDIFCVPSVSEGFPFGVAEAMALGVIPLAADSGWNKEIVGKNGVSGLLVPLTGDRNRDMNAFANNMRKLIFNKELRETMGNKAAYHVRSMFDLSRNIPDLVNRILDHPRTRVSSGISGDDTSPLYYAQEHILENARELSDYLEIQRSISGKARTGYGKRYRVKCGEDSESARLLIDYLEEPRSCKADVKIDVESLQKCAIEQCGQWCIMDLRDSKRISGWVGDERCGGFYRFKDANHECSQWYHAR